MALEQNIQEDIKAAMKAKDTVESFFSRPPREAARR